MRRRDFDIIPLEEAIDTSAIDRIARKELQNGLYEYLQHEWNEFARHYPEADRHDIYDAFYEWKRDKSNDLFIQNICSHASAVLTHVVRVHVSDKFGAKVIGKKEIWGHKGDDPSYHLAPREISAWMLEVRVQAREHTEDSYKTYGGYFHGSADRPIIVVNVDESDVWEAAMGLIQTISMGEGEGADVLTNVIAPVFVHEYAHMEQMLRGDPNTGRDLGIVTKGGGPRGGRRSPREGTVGWLRYKSSLSEIEAFAAESASELVAEASRYRNREQDYLDDSEINHILEAIAMGYASSKSLNSYTAIAWGTWSEEAERLGVDPAEMQATYRHFLKLVYRHMMNYRQRRVGTKGKWHGWHINNAPILWKAWAKDGMRTCAFRIAEYVAKEILEKHPFYDEESLKRYSEEIGRGARFINDAFFDKDDYNDHRDAAVEAAFKNLVIRLFNKEKAKQEGLQKAA
jgi:hypothetical protein